MKPGLDDLVRKAFDLRPAPPRPGVAMDLVYHDQNPDFWTVRLYRDNLNSLNMAQEDAMAIHKWVSDIMLQLREFHSDVYLEILQRREA